VTLSWSSSNNAVATVDAAGLVTTVTSGNTTVTASGGGVSGTIRLRVVPAELAVVGTLASDALGAALVNGLSSTPKTALQAALAACGTGATSGNIVSVTTCLTSARAQVASATDPTDRVLLAVLALYADEIERRLKL
jgi:alpha-L-fucosidase 2